MASGDYVTREIKFFDFKLKDVCGNGAVVHVVGSRVGQCVKKKIIDENFWIIKWKILQWCRGEAEQFYKEHTGKFFYKRLTSFMSSGPIMPLILAREDAISRWRAMMGPTKTSKAKHTHPESIRGLFGLTDTRNATHGSDSPETAAKEIKYLFPQFNPECWLTHNDEKFQAGHVIFDDNQQIHKLKINP